MNINNIKLGTFVLAGTLLLSVLLFMLGRDSNIFGRNYELRARFDNIHGLMKGNNVRYAGIQVGTVKSIKILNDTTIEVRMLIDRGMLGIIKENAIVSVGTEGLVGDRIVNITSSKTAGLPAAEGTILRAKTTTDTDQMLETLAKTNDDISTVSAALKTTIFKVNNSAAFWNLLHDSALAYNMRASAQNIRSATAKTVLVAQMADSLMADIRRGKGAAGMILKDTTFSKNLASAMLGIKTAANTADSLTARINQLAGHFENAARNDKGLVNALLQDSALASKVEQSITNIEKGTAGFNQIIDALKQNFLVRGYFKKIENRRNNK